MNIKKVFLASALGIAALAGTNLPGLEATKASADSVETNVDSIEGLVEQVGEDYFIINTMKYDDDFYDSVKVDINFTSNVKVGDYVKATGHTWRSFGTNMSATSVEIQSLTPGVHYNNEDNPEYVVGKISRKYNISYENNESQDYVVVTYPNKQGDSIEVDVALSPQSKFKVGDSVKVNNVLEWTRTTHFETEEINMMNINKG